MGEAASIRLWPLQPDAVKDRVVPVRIVGVDHSPHAAARAARTAGGNAGSWETDAQLIHRSLHDPDAFMDVVKRHQRVLYGYLARRFGPELAEEITAETFTRAFAQRARYNGAVEDARPWLFGIAANIARTHARSEARRLRAYARSGVDPDTGIAEDEAVARADARDLGPTLARALARLSEADRSVLLMYAWAEMPYEDIASALNIPVGTVRSRLNRARRVMREVIDREVSRPAPGDAL
jgi:RNA polymerase sigma factor (sigma-70 family)